MRTACRSWHRNIKLENGRVRRQGKLKIVIIIYGLVAGMLAVGLVSVWMGWAHRRFESEQRVFITKQCLERIGAAVPNCQDSFEDTRPERRFDFDQQQHS